MTDWENFEIKCTNYLNAIFGTFAHFIHKGSADSTVPDIFVETNSGKTFYIEAKDSPAQCGQFVLIPDTATHTFKYSESNKNQINAPAKNIINYMNNQFDEFSNAGTAGKDINMENGSSIFSSWIIQAYQEKGTHFFIANNYTILPIERFQEYFNVSAKYRIKRSGSSPVGKCRLTAIFNYIKSNCDTDAIERINDKKLFVRSKKISHKQEFVFEKYKYMFSQRGDEYEVRKLSNTNNANVIFTITKKNVDGISNDEFIKALK